MQDRKEEGLGSGGMQDMQEVGLGSGGMQDRKGNEISISYLSYLSYKVLQMKSYLVFNHSYHPCLLLSMVFPFQLTQKSKN